MSRPTDTHSTSDAAWAEFSARYGVGDLVEGDVVSVVPFGAFVRVHGADGRDGVDGLAPRIEWPNLPEQGSTVQARVLAIDAEHRRASFGPV